MFDLIAPPEVWNYTIFSNSVKDYFVAAWVFIGSLVVLKIFNVYLVRRLKRLTSHTRTDIDDIAIEVIENFKPPFYVFISLYIALSTLALAPIVAQTAFILLIGLIVYQATIAIQVIIEHFVQRSLTDQGNRTTAAAASLLGKVAKIIVWAMAVLFALSNFGLNVTSLIAGVSIGGIAIAFALQNILADLFSSFAIYFDRPFEIGDFIVMEDQMGTVKKIGVKTTRLKSLNGEEIVISNRQLTDKRIQNFKRMEERRAVVNFGILYDTPQDKLAQIPEIMKEIITQIPETRFDRAYFKEFSDMALRFEVVYHILSKNYDLYVATNHQILLAIKQRLDEEGIIFATPLRSPVPPPK